MPFVKVYIYFVWSTKNRKLLLTDVIRQTVFWYIKENAREKNFYVDFINRYVDHVHCLARHQLNYAKNNAITKRQIFFLN